MQELGEIFTHVYECVWGGSGSLGQGVSPRAVLPHWGHWVMSGDICGCHTGGSTGLSGWQLGMLFHTPQCPRWPPTEDSLAPNAIVKAGKPFKEPFDDVI